MGRSKDRNDARVRVVRVPVAGYATNNALLGSGDESPGFVPVPVSGRPKRLQHVEKRESKKIRQSRVSPGLFDSKIIPPPVDPGRLLEIGLDNSVLRQCVDATVVNIDLFGWTLEYAGPEGQEDTPDSKQEKARSETFFLTCNPKQSFTSIREAVRFDRGFMGTGYFEFIRDDSGENLVGIEHLPSRTMRICEEDPEPVDIQWTMVGANGELVTRPIAMRFRRYVQIAGSTRVWFKELGDPRIISARDGRVYEALPPEEEATEVLHMRTYSATEPYGLVRWFGNLPAVLGSHHADMTNLNFWKRSGIPQLAIVVSGGGVTTKTLDRIESFFKHGPDPSKAFHDVLIIEATPDLDDQKMDEKPATVHVQLKPLHNERMTDAVFPKYDEANRTKVRSSERLPPVLIGLADDHTFNSTLGARTTAEEQVFQPERSGFDETINLRVMPLLKVFRWKFVTNGPMVGDVEAFTQAMIRFNEVGAMTPNVARTISNEMLGTTFKTIEEPWGDVPFALTVAQQQPRPEEPGEPLDKGKPDEVAVEKGDDVVSLVGRAFGGDDAAVADLGKQLQKALRTKAAVVVSIDRGKTVLKGGKRAVRR